jgi:hypothetical protein
MEKLEGQLRGIAIDGAPEEPSITELLDWYGRLVTVFPDPEGRSSSSVRVKAHADIEALPHYLPVWIPRPDLLKNLYLAIYHPVTDLDTERRSLWHRGLHAIGGRHDRNDNWTF